MQHPRFLTERQQAGGSVNKVERVGHTVRRPTGPWTPAVHHLLRHLAERGVPGVPRVHGIDEQAREVLDYLDGEVAMRPWPDCLLAEEGLLTLVDWLLAVHSAQTDYQPPADARWRAPDAVWQPGMIVRHGDLGPWNTVWRRGCFVGVIDWDFALPGHPLEDLAQLLWCGVPLGSDAACRAAGVDPAHRSRRFRVCCERYGCDEQAVIDAVLAVQNWEMQGIRAWGAAGLQPWRDLLARGDVEDIAAEQAWLRAWRGR